MASSQAKEQPVIQPLNPQLRAEIAAKLPAFISGRRWFRAKTRSISAAEISDAINVSGTKNWVVITRLNYDDGGHDEYVLYAGLIELGEGGHGARPPADSGDIVAQYSTGGGASGNVVEALANENFRSTLLKVIAQGAQFSGERGTLVAAKTGALSPLSADDFALPSKISRAEQSNSSIIYGDRYILKLFRKIEPGINPDVEIGRFLTERGFAHTPAVLGTLEYRCESDSTSYMAGILQAFVPNKGDAWKYTLDSLGDFFRAALVTGPAPEGTHPDPDEYRPLLTPYAESAYLLGRRTAEMHCSLAAESADPDFAPELLRPEHSEALFKEIIGQADITFELLRRRQAVLSGAAAEEAHRALQLEHRIADRLALLREKPIEAARIRFHGDYHLGQVLWTGSDFMIIDFEGEPARPLSERRAKALPMRDVAGMLRSFQYAAYAALFGQVPGIPATPEMLERVEQWAAFWNSHIQAKYLRGYYDIAADQPFVPATDAQRRVVLDAFLIQKALYEVAYELNNRPDWVRIPLRGILSLVS